LELKIPDLEKAVVAARGRGEKVAEKAASNQRVLAFNNRLDAVVAGAFLLMAAMIFLLSVGSGCELLMGRKEPRLSETEPVWLPSGAVMESRPVGLMGVRHLALR
jgi:hypothetical protein